MNSEYIFFNFYVALVAQDLELWLGFRNQTQ